MNSWMKTKITENILEELLRKLKFSLNLYEIQIKGNKELIVYVISYGPKSK